MFVKVTQGPLGVPLPFLHCFFFLGGGILVLFVWWTDPHPVFEKVTQGPVGVPLPFLHCFFGILVLFVWSAET